MYTALRQSMSSIAVIAPPSNRPDQAWPQSILHSQAALGNGSAQLAGQSIAELTQICREQAEELEGTALQGQQACMLLHLNFSTLCCPAAKEVIITYLKRKLSSLEAAALTQQSLTPENQPPSSLPKKQAGSRFVLLRWIAYIKHWQHRYTVYCCAGSGLQPRQHQKKARPSRHRHHSF